MRASSAVLLVGYVLAVPFTIFWPGLLRVWRRREPVLFAVSETGAALVTLGWLLRGDVIGVALNAGWTLGFGAAYIRAGRRRARLEAVG